MEWNIEEFFWYGVEYGRIFMVRNGKKLSVWNTEKSSSIPFHALLDEAGSAAFHRYSETERNEGA